MIQDGENKKIMSLCGASGREHMLYHSTSNKVKVQLLSAEVLKGLPPFLVHYEGKGMQF
jgi:hypothetical protein